MSRWDGGTEHDTSFSLGTSTSTTTRFLGL
jgi:hypothetical protein